MIHLPIQGRLEGAQPHPHASRSHPWCLQAPIPGAAASKAGEQVRVAVLGASGYTGEEVVRLLALHPSFKVTALTGDRQAGKVGAGMEGVGRPARWFPP